MSPHIRWTISIHQLPPEPLVYIFHLVRDASLKASLSLQFGKAFDLDWIKVSFVCRRWRELAIGSPSLWAHIDLTVPRVAVTMLRRSMTVPIHLHARLPPSSSSFEAREPAWLIARHNISRVKELDLREVDSRELELLDQNIDGPSSLESIIIHGHQHLSLTRLLERKMPSLRVLNIWNVILPRPLPACPQLVTLKLCSHVDGILTALEILTSLEAMPMLEDVELLQVVLPMAPGTPSSALAQHSPVRLPKLKSFSIHTANFDAVYIVNTIRYPTKTAIAVSCDKSHFTETTIEAAVNICSRLRNHAFSISSMVIRYRDYAIDLDAGMTSYEMPFCLGLRPDTPGASGILLRRLCMVLPWDSIERVAIDMEEWPELWAEVLALWSRVKTVDVCGLSPLLQPKLFEGLRDLPMLETLELYQCDTKFSIRSLVDMLHHRKACGLPVPRLLYDAEEVSIDELIARMILN